mmetsp:Transcript_5054/g.16293  ORF Transcript_5054/g.16293 Transcript_5054/m.16293 type:complete len:231 (-) Transcript_5054:546-1238(-)
MCCASRQLVDASKPSPWCKPASVPFSPDARLLRFGGLLPISAWLRSQRCRQECVASLLVVKPKRCAAKLLQGGLSPRRRCRRASVAFLLVVRPTKCSVRRQRVARTPQRLSRLAFVLSLHAAKRIDCDIPRPLVVLTLPRLFKPLPVPSLPARRPPPCVQLRPIDNVYTRRQRCRPRCVPSLPGVRQTRFGVLRPCVVKRLPSRCRLQSGRCLLAARRTHCAPLQPNGDG